MTGRHPSLAGRLVGTVLSDRYRIDELISESDTGALYRGEHAHMRKRIAVKVLSPQRPPRPDLVARFEREAVAGAHVDHPNVAAAKDFGVLEDGSSFFVIEYLDGRTLRAEIAEGPFAPPRALNIAAQIARALDAAHTKGIVHRALSPDTVYLVARGSERDFVKVVDFGLAKLPSELVADADAPGRAQRIATPIAAIPMTIAYASPEFLVDADVDGRTDLYALGILLFEMIHGRVPSHGLRGAPLPSLVSRGAPRELDLLLESLVAEDREQRATSALDVAEALEALALDSSQARALTMRGSGADAVEGALVGQPRPAPRPRAPWATHWAHLPFAIRLATAGCGAIVLVVLGAIAIRSPIPEDLDGAFATPPPSTTSHSTVASAAPSSVSPPPAQDVQETTPRDLRLRFLKDVQTGRMKDSVATLAALLDRDSAAAEDREIRTAIVDLSQRITLLEDDTPDLMFSLLSSKMGTTGIDVLYELMTTKGGSRAAKRAEEILREAEVQARGTPALRIAFDLRAAKKCSDRVDLFPRAKADGDGRTLGQLQLLNRDCSRREDCCLHSDPRLRDAMDGIKDRLR